ncbi:hypothetical protein FRC07_014271, partial [Ceratobasidium sp. 392]
LINQDVKAFVCQWNAHGISGPSTKGKSPQDLRFLGHLTNGVQDDIYEDVPPEILQEFLDIDSAGAPDDSIQGLSLDEEEDPTMPTTTADIPSHSDDDITLEGLNDHEIEVVTFLRQQLQSEQQNHVRHPPVTVPRKASPFTTEEEVSDFLEALTDAREEHFEPVGYGVRPEEWEQDTYPSEYYIGSRRK